MRKIFCTLLLLLSTASLLADDVTVQVNFCASNTTTTSAKFNNFTNATNTSGAAVRLLSTTRETTDMYISLKSAFNGTNTEGVQGSCVKLGITSKEAYSAFWAQAAGSGAKSQAQLLLSGLNPRNSYDFYLFGSRKNATDNRETLYTLTGSNELSATLDCSKNISQYAQVDSVVPQSDGTIILTLQPGANNNNSTKYYYINAMRIVEHEGKGDSTFTELPVIRVLAVGNSFSEDAVEQNLYDLARESGYKRIIGNAYRGGQGLSSHWTDVTSGANTFEYRKVVNGVRSNTTGQSLESIVKDEPWDYVTFQQVSGESGLPDTFEPYLGNLLSYVQERNANKEAKYGYHETWAYAQNSTHSSFPNYNSDQMTMYNAIMNAVQTALKNHADLSFVVPSGSAVQNMRTTYIGDNMNRDGYHLDYNVGRYTAACTWLEAITGKSPVGLVYHPVAVDSVTASVCQQAAHAAILNPFSVTEMKDAELLGDNEIVTDADIKLNFGATTTTNSAWNNLLNNTKIYTGINDVNGNPTGIYVTRNDVFNGTNESGNTATTTSLDMPDEVSKSCFWGYSQGSFDNQAQQPTGGFLFFHLNPALQYDFTFYGSRANCTDNRETVYQLTGKETQQVVLNAAGNTANTVSIQNVVPDGNGQIQLTVWAGPNNTNTYHFYYLNALQIHPHASETGIDLIQTLPDEDGAIYNLQGQRVSRAQKGIYIMNGKKIFIK